MKYVLVTGDDTYKIRTETTCSIGLILKSFKLSITLIQIDPVYVDLTGREKTVLQDGTVCRGNIGKFERFLDIELTERHLISKNKLREQNKIFSDKDIIDGIQIKLPEIAKLPINGNIPEICIIDMFGEPQNILFEILQQNLNQNGCQNVFHVHACAVEAENNMLNQLNIEKFKQIDLLPDLIVGKYFSDELKFSPFFSKINIVTYSKNTDILKIPKELVKQNTNLFIQEKLQISNEYQLNLTQKYSDYSDFLAHKGIPVAVVCELSDKYTYGAVIDAFQHSIIEINRKITIKKIKSSHFEDEKNSENFKAAWEAIKSCRGIMVAGGNGKKGAEGRAIAAEYARVNKIPFLGICYGMQFCVIEFARHVCGLELANTTEIEPNTPQPIISRIIDYQNKISKNHGSSKILIKSNKSLARKILGTDYIYERHFNNYEFNKKYIEALSDAGMSFIGFSASRDSVGIIEIPDHPFFIGAQFHPEYNSRFGSSSGFYTGFLNAVINETNNF